MDFTLPTMDSMCLMKDVNSENGSCLKVDFGSVKDIMTGNRAELSVRTFLKRAVEHNQRQIESV